MKLTAGTKSMIWLGAMCITLYVVMLAFRAFIYADMYLAPGDPYGLSDVIELFLYYLFIALLSISTFIALIMCFRGKFQTKKAAVILLGAVLLLFLSYSPMHQLVARL